MGVLWFILGLILGGVAVTIIRLIFAKRVATLHVKDGCPSQLDIESWGILRNKNRAYIKIVNDDDSQE